VISKLPFPEIAGSLRRAVYSCEFDPGTDREGRPVKLWVVQPVRFRGD